MSHHQQTTTTSTFDNHGAGFVHDASVNNNGHLGSATARDGDTLSAGSTANGSFSRMPEHNGNGNNALEKDFSRRNGMITTLCCTYKLTLTEYHQHLDHNTDSDTALRQIRTAGSISISPELFEKMYLSPQNNVKGELRKTFGNPTPL
jgi:hypothetical protein